VWIGRWLRSLRSLRSRFAVRSTNAEEPQRFVDVETIEEKLRLTHLAPLLEVPA
jgi:nitroreductase